MLLLLYYSPKPMERWAANTLRTLGIILTSGFVLVTCLFLALLSMCAANGGFSGMKHSQEAFEYAMGAVVVAAVGIPIITWLARGIHRSSSEEETPRQSASASDIVSVVPRTDVRPRSDDPSLPLHLSPLSRKAIDRLVFAFGAQIVLSAAAWIFNQLHFWSGPRIFAPFPSNWSLALLVPFILYHLPYAILIFVLLKHPDRRAFAYSLAVPAVLIMQALLSVGYVSFFLANHPIGFLVLFIPWAMHIVILVLAYQAIQHVGLHPNPSSIIVAALVTFFFFSLIHVITPFLYRFAFR